jgi:microcystin-dependent protein
MTSTLRINAANTARTKPTTGDTKMSFVNTDHLGWLKCDGRAMDKTADNLLFQVIQYSFGGSGNTFNLPNPAGRVMGTIGTVTDTESRSRTYTAGQMVGELDHKLVQSEMPSHNHNDSGAQYTDSPVTGNVDGITSPNGGHTHTITDPGHTHSYVNQPNSVSPAVSLTTTEVADNVNVNQTTGSSTTGITINAVANHTHTIQSNGGDMYHNNIQPTLFYGNTFIYCGVPMRGEFPFKTGLAPVLI